MENFAGALLKEMRNDLQQIAIEADNTIQRAERSFNKVKEAVEKLKQFIADYQFKSQDEEILFYKKINPSFFKELIFFEQLYYLEVNRHLKPENEQRKIALKSLKPLNRFFNQNRQLYIYHLTGKTEMDDKYFVSNSARFSESVLASAVLENKHFTSVSFNLSKLLAFEQLRNYIKGLVMRERKTIGNTDTKQPKAKRSIWTDSKASLIELAYALQALGAVNYGKGDIKQLIADLEFVFDIQVGNAYRVFHGMLIRKKSRTPFLDNLKQALEKRLDDRDE